MTEAELRSVFKFPKKYDVFYIKNVNMPNPCKIEDGDFVVLPNGFRVLLHRNAGDEPYLTVVGFARDINDLVIPGKMYGVAVKGVSFDELPNFSDGSFYGESDEDYFVSCNSITLCEGIKFIGRRCFAQDEFKFVKSVKLPSTLRRIENDAFKGCRYLTDVEIPLNASIYIKDRAFSGCNLETLKLPKGTKYVGKECFAYNTNLESIDIMCGMNSFMGTAPFKGCKSVSEVSVSESVEDNVNALFKDSECLITVNK